MKSSLLQKYRILHFKDIIGQENNISFLKNSLYQNIFYPLYLFSGMRGSGKTTLARLFSIALLCERINDFQKNPLFILPCYECYSCQLYSNNKHPDIIELDAASHNGIDTIRSVIDNAYMLPVIASKKIYIIDEVHMLSKSAFNACLKIMEEPPENIHFILATTEIHKVIETIQSRSIILNFKPIPNNILFPYIKKITTEENLIISNEAINLIIDLGEGSVRDTLNILNRLFLISTTITENLIINEYGIIEKKKVEELIISILKKDINKYYIQKKELSLAQLGKKKFFEHAVKYIQFLLENAYINKDKTYQILDLNKILLNLYEYEELFFISIDPLGLFDLLLIDNNNENHYSLKNNKENIQLKKNDEIIDNSYSQININNENIAPINFISEDDQKIKKFLSNLEMVLVTIFSQSTITIDHQKKKLSILFKKNFSFYKDFLLKKDIEINKAKEKANIIYNLEYSFSLEETITQPTQSKNNNESKVIIKEPIKLDNNISLSSNLQTSNQNEENLPNNNYTYKNKKIYINEKNNKTKVPLEAQGPILKKINILFPGVTYLKEE
jgi:DNA polymerase-3 subunit gamma/tau